MALIPETTQGPKEHRKGDPTLEPVNREGRTPGNHHSGNKSPDRIPDNIWDRYPGNRVWLETEVEFYLT